MTPPRTAAPSPVPVHHQVVRHVALRTPELRLQRTMERRLRQLAHRVRPRTNRGNRQVQIPTLRNQVQRANLAVDI